MRTLILMALALAACNAEPDAPASNVVTKARQSPVPPPVPAPKPFAFEEENDLVDFSFGWSAEATAVPQLVSRFREEMAKNRAQLLASARADKVEREKSGFDVHQYESSTDYSTAGQSDRLLSLEVNSSQFTGGAHPNHGTAALLWDRGTAKEIKVADLFADPRNSDRLLTQRWCDSLNKAREEKRGEPVGGGGMFDECPTLDDVSIIPVDADKDGKFDKVLVVASPYVAGPGVEGDDEVELAVSPDLLAALKNEFKPSFKA